MRSRFVLGFLVAALPLLGGGLCGPTPDLPREAERCAPAFDASDPLDLALSESPRDDLSMSPTDGGVVDASMPTDAGVVDASMPTDAGAGGGDTLPIEVGSLDEAGHFAPWKDGAAIPIIPGFQGGEMVGVYLRLVDARATCVWVRVEVSAETRSGADLAPPPDAWYPSQLAIAEGGYRTTADGTTAAFLIRVDGLAWPLMLTDVNLRIDVRALTAASRGTRAVRIQPVIR